MPGPPEGHWPEMPRTLLKLCMLIASSIQCSWVQRLWGRMIGPFDRDLKEDKVYFGTWDSEFYGYAPQGQSSNPRLTS